MHTLLNDSKEALTPAVMSNSSPEDSNKISQHLKMEVLFFFQPNEDQKFILTPVK